MKLIPQARGGEAPLDLVVAEGLTGEVRAAELVVRARLAQLALGLGVSGGRKAQDGEGHKEEACKSLHSRDKGRMRMTYFDIKRMV